MEPFNKNASTVGKYKNCIKELRKDYHKLGAAVMNPRCVFQRQGRYAQHRAAVQL
jgi:hypothetical protein